MRWSVVDGGRSTASGVDGIDEMNIVRCSQQQRRDAQRAQDEH